MTAFAAVAVLAATGLLALATLAAMAGGWTSHVAKGVAADQRLGSAVTATRRGAVPGVVSSGAGAPGVPARVSGSGVSDRAGRWGVLADRLTAAAWGALTAGLLARAVGTGHAPYSNQYEFAVAFAWGVLAAAQLLVRRPVTQGPARPAVGGGGSTTLRLAVLPLALALLGYALTVDATAGPLMPALQNHWLLTAHVLAAVLAYGAAAVSFGAAVVALAAGPLRRRGIRLPAAATLDEVGHRGAVLAFPLLTLMLILGAVWADIAWGSYWSWDPKETSALLTWLIYGGYLHARVTRGWAGRRAHWLLVAGFAAVLFTYFGNLFFGGLHAYA